MYINKILELKKRILENLNIPLIGILNVLHVIGGNINRTWLIGHRLNYRNAY